MTAGSRVRGGIGTAWGAATRRFPAKKIVEALTGRPDDRVEAALSRSVDLLIVFVQYDRQKYDGALERLLEKAQGLGRIEYSVVVVDNANPGDWVHAVSNRTVHVGGDNREWEFSAFDRGLSFLDDAGVRAPVYAFVTDAFGAYGTDFLDLITPEVLQRSRETSACIGWADAWPEEVRAYDAEYRSWLRTSFLICPEPVVRRMRPLSSPIDRAELFGKDPSDPFAPTAPIDERLQRFLLGWLVEERETEQLAEQWHSRFRLDADTFSRFQDKVCAILREQMLSARLRRAGIACYDLRLYPRLASAGLGWSQLAEEDRARWQFDAWRSAPEQPDRPLLHHTDRWELPDQVDHGTDVPFSVTGWVLSEPSSDLAIVTLPDGTAFHGACETPRPDVAAVHPGYRTDRCGFRVEGVLKDLPVGTHTLRLAFEPGGPAQDEHRLRVVPSASFRVRRMMVPEHWPRAAGIPVSLEGTLVASAKARRATLLLDGRPVEAATNVGPAELGSAEIWSQPVAVTGLASGEPGDGVHRLEVDFELESGSRYRWRKHVVVSGATEVGHTVRRLDIGPYDASLGLTQVALLLEVAGAEPGDQVELSREGVGVLSEPVHLDPAGAIGHVVVDRSIEGVPPGRAHFTMTLVRSGERRPLLSLDCLVGLDRPEVTIDTLDVVASGTRSHRGHRLRVRGWLRNHFLVDCLIAEVDGARATVFGLTELRPDVARELDDPMVFRQGFDVSFEVRDASPGEHVIHLVACQKDGEVARVSRRVEFPEPAGARFALESAALEHLLGRATTPQYGSVSVGGRLTTAEPDTRVALLLDDRRVDQRTFGEPGAHEFRLHAVPDRAGEFEVRLAVLLADDVVWTSEGASIEFRPVSLPAAVRTAVSSILDRFDLRSKILGRVSDDELTRRLVSAQPERQPDYLAMLERAHRSIIGEAVRPPETPRTDRRRESLRVLFVSWEVPSLDHGGGVYLRHILERLGRRHRITLVHTFGIDETRHLDSLGTLTDRVVSVPRRHLPAHYRGDSVLPHFLYDLYVPELRGVVEQELAGGDYDLVDYEYTALAPYVVPGPPSVLGVHEVGYSAILNTELDRPRSVEEFVPVLDRLIRRFHFETALLPQRCPNLAVLTREDAEAITSFNSEAKLFVNPSGVDTRRFASADGSVPRRPVFVYVGNFQHPPNTRAVEFFATQVMPRVLAAHPQARFEVVGSRMNDDVRAFGDHPGVDIVGFVEDLPAHLASVSAFVAPIFTGAGMRIKVLEALASGAVLVGTDLSVRGLDVVDDEHYLRAHSASEFARAACAVLEQPDRARRIAGAGRALAQGFDWDETAECQDRIWSEMLGVER